MLQITGHCPLGTSWPHLRAAALQIASKCRSAVVVAATALSYAPDFAYEIQDYLALLLLSEVHQHLSQWIQVLPTHNVVSLL